MFTVDGEIQLSLIDPLVVDMFPFVVDMFADEVIVPFVVEMFPTAVIVPFVVVLPFGKIPNCCFQVSTAISVQSEKPCRSFENGIRIDITVEHHSTWMSIHVD